MRRWTRSIPESMALYLEADVETMWRMDNGGMKVYGCVEVKEAHIWAFLTLKPTDCFQLRYLSEWLVHYSATLADSAYSRKFKGSIKPLVSHSKYVYGNTWFWTLELERAWLSLEYSLHCEWNPSQAYLEKVKWTASDIDDWESESDDHVRMLSTAYWN